MSSSRSGRRERREARSSLEIDKSGGGGGDAASSSFSAAGGGGTSSNSAMPEMGVGARYIQQQLAAARPLSAAEQLQLANQAMSFNKILCYVTSVVVILLITLIAVFYLLYKRLHVREYYYKVVIYGGPALILFLIILAIVTYFFKSLICCMKEKREKIRRERFDAKIDIERGDKPVDKKKFLGAKEVVNRDRLESKSDFSFFAPESSFGKPDWSFLGGADSSKENNEDKGKSKSRGNSSTNENDQPVKSSWSMDKIICCTGMSFVVTIIIIMIIYVYYIQKKYGLKGNQHFYNIVVYGGAALIFTIISMTLLIFFVKKVYKCFKAHQRDKKEKQMDALMDKINKRKNKKKNKKGKNGDEDEDDEVEEEEDTSYFAKIKNFFTCNRDNKSKMKIKKKRKSQTGDTLDEIAARRARRRSISERRSSLGSNIEDIMFSNKSLIWDIEEGAEFLSNPYTQPEIVRNFTTSGDKVSRSPDDFYSNSNNNKNDEEEDGSNAHQSLPIPWRGQLEILENRRINLLIISSIEDEEKSKEKSVNVWDDDT